MPSKSKSNNYDALGSIFDFMFRESEKPAPIRKKIKPTGISGHDMFTDAIASTLENPGVFLTNNALDEMNSALDIEIGSVEFDEGGKVKFSSASLIDAIKDPAAYVDKAIKRNQANRKASRAKFLGEAMDDFITTAWAHKYGDLEVKKAAIATSVANQKKESYKVAEAMGQYAKQKLRADVDPRHRPYPTDVDYMSERSLDLLGKRTFGSTWNTMDTKRKTEFTQLLSGVGKTQADIQRYLANKYGTNEAREFGNATREIAGGKPDTQIDVFDHKLYKSLERQNLRSRIGALSGATPGSKKEGEKRMYEKTLLLLNMDEKSKIDMRKDLDDLRKELSTTTDKNRQRELKKQIKDSKGALRILNSQSAFGQIGQWEGYANSLKGVWGTSGSNVAASVFVGDFFDARKNIVLNPVVSKSIGDTSFYVAKREINSAGKDRVLLNTYNKMGENLYYATPRSILRTFLYNGEGFARLMQRRLDSFGAVTAGISSIDSIKKDFFEDFGKSDMKNLDKVVQDTINKLKRSRSLSPEQLAKVEKLLKGSAQFRKLTHRFSYIARFQKRWGNKITGFLENKIFKKTRVGFAKLLLKSKAIRKLLVKTGANKLLGKWIAKGGVKVLVKTLVTTIAGAVGLVGTPLASFVVSAVTWIATDILMKMFKESLVVMKYVIMGLIAIIAILILQASGSVSKFNKTTFSYSNAIPDSVINCTLYDERPLEPSEYPWGIPIIPPPSGEDCPLGAGSFRCTQGFVDVACWSHQNYTQLLPVDLADVNFIYAPQFCDTGDCSITDIRVINCSDGTNAGGVVILEANDGNTTYTFKLLHVQPLAGKGQKLTSGQPVALVQTNLQKGLCWTGAHLHLETRQNGSSVDPLALLQQFNCNVPSESGCSDSPYGSGSVCPN